jgi:hypothetical protein
VPALRKWQLQARVLPLMSEPNKRSRWTVEGLAGALLGVAGLATDGLRGLVFAAAAFLCLALVAIVARGGATTRKRDVAIVGLTVALVAAGGVAWTWESLTSSGAAGISPSSRAAVRQVTDELLYDGARVKAALDAHQYLEARPLSLVAFERHQNELAAVLPFHASHAIYVFYSFVSELDARSGGLIGRDGEQNLKEAQRLLREAIGALSPYVE